MHLKEAFGQRYVGDITADDIEHYLRRRLQDASSESEPQAESFNETGSSRHRSSGIAGSSADDERRSSEEASAGEPLRRSGVSGKGEGPVSAALHGLVGAAADRVPGTRVLAQHHPDHHGIRTSGVQGTDADEEGAGGSGNAVVWIPDSKTPNGIAEVPLTDLALEAFREQIESLDRAIWLFPSDREPDGHQKTLKTVWHARCGGPRCRTSGSTICARPMRLA